MRNIVFGSASFTMPSTSIASSLATIPPRCKTSNKSEDFTFLSKKVVFLTICSYISMYKIKKVVNKERFVDNRENDHG